MATLSELYKKGDVEEGQLGALAKAVICAKLGCHANGQEVAFGNHTLRLTDSLHPREGVKQSTQRPQAWLTESTRRESPRPASTRPTEKASATTSRKFELQNEQRLRQEPARQSSTARVQNHVEQRSGVQGQPAAKGQGLFAVGKTEVKPNVQTTPQKPAVEQRVQKVAKVQPLFPPKQEVRQSAPPTTAKRPAPPSGQGDVTPSGDRDQPQSVLEPPRLEELASFVARDAKSDVKTATLVLSSVLSYLSAYPSVGILRLIDDIAKKTKADQRVIKTAIEALRGIDVVEIVDDVVVNLKRHR